MTVLVRPIGNENDYDAALAEVETLMNSTPGTLGGVRLDALVTRIEAYETRRWPVEVGRLSCIEGRKEQ